MKPNPAPISKANQNPTPSPDVALDGRILVELFLGTLAGILAYVSAVITTVVESGGLWQSFWLWVCIATFASACFFIIRAGSRMH
jgi:hypothetical protein